MALLCNDAIVKGKTRQIWCEHTNEPCLHVRYCAVSMRYYQTDAAASCKVRLDDGKKNKTDADYSI